MIRLHCPPIQSTHKIFVLLHIDTPTKYGNVVYTNTKKWWYAYHKIVAGALAFTLNHFGMMKTRNKIRSLSVCWLKSRHQSGDDKTSTMTQQDAATIQRSYRNCISKVIISKREQSAGKHYLLAQRKYIRQNTAHMSDKMKVDFAHKSQLALF